MTLDFQHPRISQCRVSEVCTLDKPLGLDGWSEWLKKWAPGLVRNLISKVRWRATEENTWCWLCLPHAWTNTCIYSYVQHAHIHICSTCTQRPNSLEWQNHRATVPEFSVMFIFVMGVNQGKRGFPRLSKALHIMHHWSFHWETFKSQRNWWLWICIILLLPTPTILDTQAKQ